MPGSVRQRGAKNVEESVNRTHQWCEDATSRRHSEVKFISLAQQLHRKRNTNSTSSCHFNSVPPLPSQLRGVGRINFSSPWRHSVVTAMGHTSAEYVTLRLSTLFRFQWNVTERFPGHRSWYGQLDHWNYLHSGVVVRELSQRALGMRNVFTYEGIYNFEKKRN